jgi:hypothetical protein
MLGTFPFDPTRQRRYLKMSDDLFIALERARELVGEGVWEKLSHRTRDAVIREELRTLDAERIMATMVLTPRDAHNRL